MELAGLDRGFGLERGADPTADSCGEHTSEQCAGDEQLSVRGKPANAVPASDPVAWEELPATGPRKRQDVLQVGRSGGDGTHGRRIEWSPYECQRQHSRDAAHDLESPRRDVLVRNPVACEVEDRSEEGGSARGAGEQAADRAGRDVQRDDHG
jgi:hypothetical protein